MPFSLKLRLWIRNEDFGDPLASASVRVALNGSVGNIQDPVPPHVHKEGHTEMICQFPRSANS